MVWDKKVPFDQDGNMLDYEPWKAHEWREAQPFHATLMYNGYKRNLRSAVFHFKDEDDHRYSMFLSEFDRLLRKGEVERGWDVPEFTGWWTFVKRGANYSLAMTEAPRTAAADLETLFKVTPAAGPNDRLYIWDRDRPQGGVVVEEEHNESTD